MELRFFYADKAVFDQRVGNAGDHVGPPGHIDGVVFQRQYVVHGGGGLGQIAISYGYNRYQTDVLFVTVALLIVLMQVIQIVGMKISRKTDKRVRN